MSLNKGITLNFEPSIKQGIAWDYLMDDKTTFVGYGGSAYSGKSYLMCYWLLIMCLQYSETTYGLGRRELTNLKKSTLLTLFKIFAECKITPEHYTYNQQLNTIEFFNGSKIFLIDTAYQPSDPLYQRFGGYELTACAIDESGESDEEAVNILFTRCGRKNNDKHGIKAKMLECFNPSKAHIYRRYYKPWSEGQLKPNYQFIKALPQDNPAPDVEQYIQNIMDTQSKNTVERLIFGNFEYDDDPSALIEYNSIVDIFTNHQVLDHDASRNLLGTRRADNSLITEKYITWDVSGKGKDKAVIMAWHGLAVIDYKIIEVDDGTEQVKAVTTFKDKHRIGNSHIIFDADGIGGLAGMHFRGAVEFHSGSRPLNEENFQNLKTQCYYKLADIINKHELFFNTEDPLIKKFTIEELEQVKSKDIDKDGKFQLIPKDIVKKILGRSPDHSDALMLRMYPIVKKGIKSGARTILMKF